MARLLKWRVESFWENINVAAYDDVGHFGIPKMLPCKSVDVDEWMVFKQALNTDPSKRKRIGVHFWQDDYEFRRVWERPRRYAEFLSGFGAVASPDFSIYDDFPEAMKIWNLYRNAWLGRYWQDQGINVVPSPQWAGPESWEYCFDAIPQDSIVAVSSVGTMRGKDDQIFFIHGYNQMIFRLHPTKVYFAGKVPDDIPQENIIRIPSFVQKWRKKPESEENLHG